ncbi:hypothetical protein O6H91_17G074100 [Diphasiastrum complanatum]|uniref:Uncharacterized protein n=1 Tax=Diphasiastrum complanatum TaxID=34168 RepID=A0ACC2B828_DIPCM|nr:hypothetical protein O6H91_17G074100 [Diphasiastrum complanatum]
MTFLLNLSQYDIRSVRTFSWRRWTRLLPCNLCGLFFFLSAPFGFGKVHVIFLCGFNTHLPHTPPPPFFYVCLLVFKMSTIGKVLGVGLEPLFRIQHIFHSH